MKLKYLLITIIGLSVGNIIGFAYTSIYERRTVEEQCTQIARALLNNYFAENSYKELTGHKILLEKDFGEIGAYTQGIRIPYFVWADKTGVIHIELDSNGKMQSPR